MTKYKGYYIDGVVFKNKAEIDEFIKQSILDRLQIFFSMFNSDRYSAKEKFAISCEIAIREKRLNTEFGMSYAEIEKFEENLLTS